jgi:hypothetical protein
MMLREIRRQIFKLLSTTAAVAAMVLVAMSAADAGASESEDLCIDITPEHPLLIFSLPAQDFPDATAYAQRAAEAYHSLPGELQAYSVVQVESRGADIAARHQWFRQMLMSLQDGDVPVILRLADGDLSRVYPLERAKELVQEFTCVKGIVATELPFEEYYEFASDSPEGMPPVVRWLMGAIDLAVENGRIIVIELDKIRWPRVMSNTWCAPLYAKFTQSKPHVVPVARMRGPNTVAQTSALMGLWLEDAVANWGIGPDSAWYQDSHYIAPGVFGTSPSAAGMPANLYRAMILNGAMTGASIYSFGCGRDLWFGDCRQMWETAIYPTLTEMIQGGLIARQDFVRKKVKTAYQLAQSRTPEDFHLNLRDIDGVLSSGFLMQGAYAMERPAQAPELIPNTGRHYWVPIISAFAPQSALSQFESVTRPGAQTSGPAWTELLDRLYQPDGEGTAFISRVGRGTFIMNTAENWQQRQTFKVEAVPTPVRKITAKRDPGGIAIEWPFREGDLSYKVYRRIQQEPRFAQIAGPMEERSYIDTSADTTQTLVYSVTALTDDAEPYEGSVDYGEYLLLSNVESRIGEEVILSPLLTTAESKPTAQPGTSNATSEPWWPNYQGVTEAQFPSAEAVVKKIEDWERAFSRKDLDGTVSIYSTGYADPQGWQLQYVRRAFQWFFEHYNACAMHRQIRKWDFSQYETSGQIGLLLYCRFEGYATTDPSGRFADVPAWFPRTDNSEVWIYFGQSNGNWQIVRTDPALPNFNDILSFSTSPYDAIQLGPDK